MGTPFTINFSLFWSTLKERARARGERRTDRERDAHMGTPFTISFSLLWSTLKERARERCGLCVCASSVCPSLFNQIFVSVSRNVSPRLITAAAADTRAVRNPRSSQLHAQLHANQADSYNPSPVPHRRGEAQQRPLPAIPLPYHFCFQNPIGPRVSLVGCSLHLCTFFSPPQAFSLTNLLHSCKDAAPPSCNSISSVFSSLPLKDTKQYWSRSYFRLDETSLPPACHCPHHQSNDKSKCYTPPPSDLSSHRRGDDGSEVPWALWPNL